MLLGEIIRDLTDEARAAQSLIAIGDIAMLARVRTLAEANDESAGAYAAGAVASFAGSAGDDAWLALMTTIERAQDPGKACLCAMIEWALREDGTTADKACSCKTAG